MSNANYEPLGANRKAFRGWPQANQPTTLQQTKYVDAMGKPIEQKIVSGACSKCGFTGHLPFQCRNNMPIDIDGILRKPLGSSSSPSDFETPLQKEDRKAREKEAKRLKKQLKKAEKKRKKETRKRKRSSSVSSSDSDRHHSKKSKHKKDHKSKKSKKRRRHSSSSSSSD